MLTGFLNTLATIISVTSLLIVTYGALIGVISFFRNELKRLTGNYSITNIRKLRAVFGTYLLLGLEFLIASDILKTVLEPTLNELAILGGIVVLRTVLSVFLNKEIKETGENAKQFGVKCASIFQNAGNLSGGNQQKVVLAKWMFNLPDVLILDEPTRGIDVGAKYDIYCIINELAASGKCVLVISSELPELLGVCDRIYVMNEGEIKGEKLVQDATQENIMRLLI